MFPLNFTSALGKVELNFTFKNTTITDFSHKNVSLVVVHILCHIIVIVCVTIRIFVIDSCNETHLVGIVH